MTTPGRHFPVPGSRFPMRFRSIFQRGATEQEMQDEMQLHLDRAVDRLIARGLSPEEARLAARREFGNVAVLQEEGRDARGARWIESVAGDVRFALRHFARKPLTAVTIVLVLSLGIGVHSAVFSLIQSVTTRPAPGVPHDDALVRIRGKERFDPSVNWLPRAFSYLEYRELAERRELFSAVAGWRVDDVSLDVGAVDYGSTRVQFVTGEFFSTVGVRPILGPGIVANEHQGAPELVAVIGHALWQSAFAASPNVIGMTIRVNDVPLRIVGVAPRRFNGAVPSTSPRMVWMPLSARPPIMRSNGQSLASPDSAMLETIARLRPAVTLAQANAAVHVIDGRFVEQVISGRRTGLYDADVVALRGDTQLSAYNESLILVALYGAMAFLILLITCTNVSALVVGAAVTRRHEIAIRLSLGASRRRLVRQLLTESMLLAVAGGALGLVLYWWITTLVAARLPASDLAPDLATALFTLCFALGTGILFGLSPALHATRRGVADALKDSGAGATGRSRLQRAFVVAQIALTQPLLVGVAMLLALVLQDGAQPLAEGVAERVILVRFDISAMGSHEAKNAAVAATMKRIAAAPGVVAIVPNAAGIMLSELAVVPSDRGDLPLAGRPLTFHMEATSPGYFALLDVPIIRGRDLVASDSASRVQPIVISSNLARDLWGGTDPLGKRLANTHRFGTLGKDAVVVGVFDARHATTRGSGLSAYVPQDNRRFIDGYLIRTAGPAALLVPSVRALIRAEMPQIPIGRLETLAERAESDRSEALQVSGAAGAGGVLALLLASIGLYGVVSLAFGQRRREIGIRIALGARPQQVVRMLFASGLRLTQLGLVLGLPLSIIVLKFIAEQAKLPDINLFVVGAAITVVVIAVASFATWLPARRAATVDPTVALRAD